MRIVGATAEAFFMKRLILSLGIILGWTSTAFAAAPDTLSTLREIHSLSNSEASHMLPATFEATVIYCRSWERTIFVQDGDLAIYVQPVNEVKFTPGDRVLIQGTTRPSFRPFVVADRMTLVRHETLPKPQPATFDELIRAQHDGALVSIRGVVRTADSLLSANGRSTRLRIVTDGGYLDADVDGAKENAFSGLLDAEVEVTGAAAGRFDGKMQQTGILIHVSSPAGVKVLKRAGASPWALPTSPMDEVLTTFHVKDLTKRVRVRGTITYYHPGSAVVLQSGAKSLWIRTETSVPLRIGDLADATGFPDAHDGFLTLTGGEIQDEQIPLPITPYLETWQQLVRSRHLFDLVSIEAEVVTAVRGPSQDEYALVSDGYMFSGIYRHGEAPLSPMKQVPPGSQVRVTGICILDDANPFEHNVPFDILLRSPDDIALVATPSWLNIRNLIRILSFMLLLVVAVGVWGWTLRRKVRQQTAALSIRIAAEAELERSSAQVEQRRSRILEDINGSAPLAEILENITAMVSFRLKGAPSWCEITDGARLGEYPPNLGNLRVIENEIPARNGSPLGKLFAGCPADTKASANEADALSVGVKLAAVAIETRRLYADLRHRSDFDQLTDIHNRFSLDKRLDAQIEQTREKAGIFGLIYIDLDGFKQVNDLYGHRVGDLYLQEITLRMKRQLRSADLLARLGGDEFAALVPVVRSRVEVEEIAQRLEHSFDEPFEVEGYELRGSASVGIALYPEDGVSRDALLSAADAAMYVAKYTRRQAAEFSPDDRG